MRVRERHWAEWGTYLRSLAEIVSDVLFSKETVEMDDVLRLGVSGSARRSLRVRR